jgi:hypothetical protein
VIIAAVLLVGLLGMAQTALALETTAHKIAKIEARYGIVVRGDIVEGLFADMMRVVRTDIPVEEIPFEYVAALEDLLRKIPVELQQFMRQSADKTLTIRISLVQSAGLFTFGGRVLAQYTPSEHKIQLFVGNEGFWHEYGHAVDFTFLYTNAAFRATWKSFNNGVSYGANYYGLSDEQQSAFASAYAMSSIEEDIAETFDMLIDGKSAHEPRKNGTNLAKKLDLLESTIENIVGKTGLFPAAHPQTPSAWATESVARFNDLNGAETPDFGLYQANITREDFCAYAIYIAKKIAAVKGITLEIDAKPPAAFDDTYDLYVRQAYSLGIVNGKGNDRFDPSGKITRQESAVLIANLLRLFGCETTGFAPADYKDNFTVASWAKDSVNAVSAVGIMNGVGGDRFSPLGTYTYEQACKSLIEAYDYVTGDPLPIGASGENAA